MKNHPEIQPPSAVTIHTGRVAHTDVPKPGSRKSTVEERSDRKRKERRDQPDAAEYGGRILSGDVEDERAEHALIDRENQHRYQEAGRLEFDSAHDPPCEKQGDRGRGDALITRCSRNRIASSSISLPGRGVVERLPRVTLRG